MLSKLIEEAQKKALSESFSHNEIWEVVDLDDAQELLSASMTLAYETAEKLVLERCRQEILASVTGEDENAYYLRVAKDSPIFTPPITSSKTEI
jgi:hypothetical protein